MVITVQNRKIDMTSVSRLYPAAIIEYADGTVTQISLEWFDKMANDDVTLINYALFFHHKEEVEPTVFTYTGREELEAELRLLAQQLKS